ncbi:hypothetical protein AAMO2058_000954400 [Amorphochlora amoebiformis]
MATLREWNSQFQKLMDRMTDDYILEQEIEFTELAQLAKDFVHTAVTIGKIIIQERHLPPASKTIQPKQMGGQAGGEKFISHNIMWKFAVDSHHGFFGTDEYAAKACSHELLGLTYIHQFKGDTDLHVPLCCLVDYLGFRLIAMSYLPISKKTLVVGSGDCGGTVEMKDEELNRRLGILAKRLNLKTHTVKTLFNGMSHPLHTCFDLEGHKGDDGRYYVIDCARLFPAEPPDPTIRNGHLYRMLRPELVRTNRVPLSSDVYLKLASHDKKSMDEVSNAFRRLRLKVIPKFAAWLDSHQPTDSQPPLSHESPTMDKEQRQEKEDLLFKSCRLALSVAESELGDKDGMKKVKSPQDMERVEYQNLGQATSPDIIRANLSAYLHMNGVNVRHLGRVRSFTKSVYWRSGLLVEAVARTLKQLLRQRYRTVMRTTAGLSLEPLRVEIARFLNSWFGNTPKSNRLWAALHNEVSRRFPEIFRGSPGSNGQEVLSKRVFYDSPMAVHDAIFLNNSKNVLKEFCPDTEPTPTRGGLPRGLAEIYLRQKDTEPLPQSIEHLPRTKSLPQDSMRTMRRIREEGRDEKVSEPVKPLSKTLFTPPRPELPSRSASSPPPHGSPEIPKLCRSNTEPGGSDIHGSGKTLEPKTTTHGTQPKERENEGMSKIPDGTPYFRLSDVFLRFLEVSCIELESTLIDTVRASAARLRGKSKSALVTGSQRLMDYLQAQQNRGSKLIRKAAAIVESAEDHKTGCVKQLEVHFESIRNLVNRSSPATSSESPLLLFLQVLRKKQEFPDEFWSENARRIGVLEMINSRANKFKKDGSKEDTEDCSVFDFEEPFDVSQVWRIRAKVKEMNIANYAQGTALLIRSVRSNREAQHPIQKQEAHRIGHLAIQRFDGALRLNLLDHLSLCNIGMLISMVFRNNALALKLYMASHVIEPSHIRTMFYAGLSFNHISPRTPSISETWYRRAIKAAHKGGIDGALKCGHAASNVYKQLGELYTTLTLNAKECFENAIECNPTHPLPVVSYFGFITIKQRAYNRSPGRSPGRSYGSFCGTAEPLNEKIMELVLSTLSNFAVRGYWRSRLKEEDLAFSHLTNIKHMLNTIALYGETLAYCGRVIDALKWLRKALDMAEGLPKMYFDPQISVTYARIILRHAESPPSHRQALQYLFKFADTGLWSLDEGQKLDDEEDAKSETTEAYQSYLDLKEPQSPEVMAINSQNENNKTAAVEEGETEERPNPNGGSKGGQYTQLGRLDMVENTAAEEFERGVPQRVPPRGGGGSERGYTNLRQSDMGRDAYERRPHRGRERSLTRSPSGAFLVNESSDDDLPSPQPQTEPLDPINRTGLSRRHEIEMLKMLTQPSPSTPIPTGKSTKSSRKIEQSQDEIRIFGEADPSHITRKPGYQLDLSYAATIEGTILDIDNKEPSSSPPQNPNPSANPNDDQKLPRSFQNSDEKVPEKVTTIEKFPGNRPKSSETSWSPTKRRPMGPPRVLKLKISALEETKTPSTPTLSPGSEKESRDSREEKTIFCEGDVVSIRYSADGQWYPGIVIGVEKDGEVRVRYNSFDTVEVKKPKQLRLINKKTSRRRGSPSPSSKRSKTAMKRLKRALRNSKREQRPATADSTVQTQKIASARGKEKPPKICGECGISELKAILAVGEGSEYCSKCWVSYLKRNALRVRATNKKCERCGGKRLPSLKIESLGVHWCVVCWARSGGDGRGETVNWKEAHAVMHGYIGRLGIREGNKSHWHYIANSICYAEFLAIVLKEIDLAHEYWQCVERRDPFNLAVYREQARFWLSLGKTELADEAFRRAFITVEKCERMWLGSLPVTPRFLRAFRRLYLRPKTLSSKHCLPLYYRREKYNLVAFYRSALPYTAPKQLHDDVNEWIKAQPRNARGWGGDRVAVGVRNELRTRAFCLPGSPDDGFTLSKGIEHYANLAKVTITAMTSKRYGQASRRGSGGNHRNKGPGTSGRRGSFGSDKKSKSKSKDLYRSKSGGRKPRS